MSRVEPYKVSDIVTIAICKSIKSKRELLYNMVIVLYSKDIV